MGLLACVDPMTEALCAAVIREMARASAKAQRRRSRAQPEPTADPDRDDSAAVFEWGVPAEFRKPVAANPRCRSAKLRVLERR